MTTQPGYQTKKSELLRDIMDLMFKDDMDYILIARDSNKEDCYIITNTETRTAFGLMDLGHATLSGGKTPDGTKFN